LASNDVVGSGKFSVSTRTDVLAHLITVRDECRSGIPDSTKVKTRTQQRLDLRKKQMKFEELQGLGGVCPSEMCTEMNDLEGMLVDISDAQLRPVIYDVKRALTSAKRFGDPNADALERLEKVTGRRLSISVEFRETSTKDTMGELWWSWPNEVPKNVNLREEARVCTCDNSL
jgi:hypothetical protein